MNSLESDHYLLSATLQRERLAEQDEYLLSLQVLQDLDQVAFHPKVTFLVGENGSGKSTLLEALAVGMGLNPEGGSKNFNFSTRATHSGLHKALKLIKGVRRADDYYFLRAESFYNVATTIDVLDEQPSMAPSIKQSYGGKSLHQQSHGESFMSLLEHRFGGNGLYFLDEPEAALSPARQLHVLARLHELVGLKSQFIIATHSPILLAYPDSLIYEVRDGRLVATEYEQTEHYQVFRGFLDNHRSMLRELLS